MAKRTRTKSDLDQHKRALARVIANSIAHHQLTQAEAARRTRDAQSQLSLLVNGRLRGFSMERMLRTLSRLGCEVTILVRQTRSRRGRILIRSGRQRR